MSKLYSSPLRVYLLLAVLALAGLFSGMRLPVSLFPNSSKPKVSVEFGYGNGTADEFLRTYGTTLESQLRGIQTEALQVEKIHSSYNRREVEYEVEFRWGNDNRAALREVQAVANSFAARMPVEVRDSLSVQTWNENSGFIAISFFSAQRSLDEVYDIIEPLIMPLVSKVQDAENPGIWNPSSKEIRVELNPERMAALQLLPRNVADAIEAALASYSGGSVTVGTQQLSVQMPRQVLKLEDLSRIPVRTPSGQSVHLGDVAKVDHGLMSSGTRILKTSGASSLILFAQPKPGGNIKRMAEEILDVVRTSASLLPRDIEYKVVVDPSEFIRRAINNVFHEVLIGAFLAVAVLFLFIGSFRNVVTAAIEIPLSMVLAFILMRFSGMNLNLISLGGLALSAGMNVDASVVVMENIFRHFEELPKGAPLGYADRLRIITRSVAEVRFAVIASTIASLVVFLPLAFTSDLSYAILGDLAKTVVFSHGFSAFVALLLVPTVRLHLMSSARPGADKAPRSPIEPQIRKLEELYGEALRRFIQAPKAKWMLYGGSAAALALLVAFALPRLPKEILGKPDTDRMMLGVNTRGNTLIRQMESQVEEVEARLLAKFGSRILYTFTRVNSLNSGWIMSRLKDKADMQALWKELEAEFANTPFVKFWIAPWNPAELPIPNPPQLRAVVRGGTVEERAEVARQIEHLLDEKKAFPRIWAEPEVARLQAITLRPNIEQWTALKASGIMISPGDLADFTRVATIGRKVGSLDVDGRTTSIFMRYPDNFASTAEDLASLPIGIGPKLIPLKALAQVRVEESPPTIYREDERDLFVVMGKKNEADDNAAVAKGLEGAEEVIAGWKAKNPESKSTVYLEDAQIDLTEALKQLSLAVALSIALIFLTLLIQFGSFMNALLVLVAVPLGFIGVLAALTVFRSTLSLNSVLGVILLNGIAVANSIILVDFLKRLVDRGMEPLEAAVTAGRKRLRPILITSLTTILGMLPIAIGMGEGGRILQPLGIAVSGGLWVSMGLTLFVVPALQVSYLTWLSRHGVGKTTQTKAASEPVEDDESFERSGARQTVALVSSAIVADEVAAEAIAEGAPSRDQISRAPRLSPPESLQ